MTKAIVFDMGGVILSLDRDLCLHNFKTKAGFSDIEDFLDIYHQKGFISDFEEGILDEEGFYQECFKHSRPGATPADIRDSFNSLLKCADQDVLRQVRELSEAGYDLYVLSNNNPICTRRFKEIMAEEGCLQYFKNMYFSFEWRLLKPGKEIYQKLVDTIGCPAGEILFIDDAVSNVEGAKSVGINAVLYAPGMDIAALAR